jgi:hypothetical protein
MEFTEVEIFQWLCGKKMAKRTAKREAGANPDLCQTVTVFR